MKKLLLIGLLLPAVTAGAADSPEFAFRPAYQNWSPPTEYEWTGGPWQPPPGLEFPTEPWAAPSGWGAPEEWTPPAAF